MKGSKSIFALLAAIAIHMIILGGWWSITHTFPHHEKLPLKEKRFGVRFSEMPTLSEQTEPDTKRSDSDISPLVTQSSASKPHEQRQNALLSPTLPIVNDSLHRYTPEERDTLPRSVLHHYGDEFFELSAGEQHYIIDNLQRIRKINEVVGTRLLREKPDEEIDPDDSNIVEFTLNPDGSISDLHLQKNRVGTLLDELTMQTITLAYPKYPRPEQPTLIRIRVYIVVK